MKGCRGSRRDWGASSKQVKRAATCRGYYSCCTVLLFGITLQICYVWIFEYLGGPTFEWGGPIFGREGSQKYAHPPLWAAT